MERADVTLMSPHWHAEFYVGFIPLKISHISHIALDEDVTGLALAESFIWPL